MIKAILFDFDGTILDTETPEKITWDEIFAEYDLKVDSTIWEIVTGASDDAFDMAMHLEDSIGFPIDKEAVRCRAHDRRMLLINQQAPLPGVVEIIKEAAASHIKLAVVSNSTRDWVEGHLTRLGLIHFFEAVICGEDVEKMKPDPEPFNNALGALGVNAAQAIVFEDSFFGVGAAKAAGIYTIAVPNHITALMDLSGADRVLNTLAGQSLISIIRHVESVGEQSRSI